MAQQIDKKDGVAIRSPLAKIRFDLLPVLPMVEVAKVFTFGASNYGDRNWEMGFTWSRCSGAMLRHLFKWMAGQDRDDESGLHHMAHVIANALFLLEYSYTGQGKDDRVIHRTPEELLEIFRPINTPKEK